MRFPASTKWDLTDLPNCLDKTTLPPFGCNERISLMLGQQVGIIRHDEYRKPHFSMNAEMWGFVVFRQDSRQAMDRNFFRMVQSVHNLGYWQVTQVFSGLFFV